MGRYDEVIGSGSRYASVFSEQEKVQPSFVDAAINKSIEAIPGVGQAISLLRQAGNLSNNQKAAIEAGTEEGLLSPVAVLAAKPYDSIVGIAGGLMNDTGRYAERGEDYLADIADKAGLPRREADREKRNAPFRALQELGQGIARPSAQSFAEDYRKMREGDDGYTSYLLEKSEWLKQKAVTAREGMTVDAKQELKNLEDAKGLFENLKAIATNPNGFGLTVLESVPSTAALFVLPESAASLGERLLAKSINKVGEKAASDFVLANSGKVAAPAVEQVYLEAKRKAAIDIADKFATNAMAGGEALQAGISQMQQTHDAIQRLPEDKLAGQPRYNELLKQNSGDKKLARDAYAAEAGLDAGGVSFAGTFLGSKVSGGAKVSADFARGKFANVADAVKTTHKQGMEEAYQSLFGDTPASVVQRDYGDDSVQVDPLGNAVQSYAAGATMGAAMAGVSNLATIGDTKAVALSNVRNGGYKNFTDARLDLNIRAAKANGWDDIHSALVTEKASRSAKNAGEKSRDTSSSVIGLIDSTSSVDEAIATTRNIVGTNDNLDDPILQEILNEEAAEAEQNSPQQPEIPAAAPTGLNNGQPYIAPGVAERPAESVGDNLSGGLPDHAAGGAGAIAADGLDSAAGTVASVEPDMAVGIGAGGSDAVNKFAGVELIHNSNTAKDLVEKYGIDEITAGKLAHEKFPMARDSVTGLIEGRRRNEAGLDGREFATAEAEKYVSAHGGNAFWAQMDIANLGGLNEFFGNNNEKADIHFKALSDIVHDELKKIGANIVDGIRTGGDEFGTLIEGDDLTKDKINQALSVAQVKIKEYANTHGFGDIIHPKYKDDASRRGVGVHFGVAQIKPGYTPKTVYDDAITELDNRKKGILNESGIARQVRAGEIQHAGHGQGLGNAPQGSRGEEEAGTPAGTAEPGQPATQQQEQPVTQQPPAPNLDSGQQDQNVNASAPSEVDARIRGIVEQIVRHRANASQINASRAFDNALADAKKLMNGERVKSSRFKKYAEAFKKHQPLADLMGDLADREAAAEHAEKSVAAKAKIASRKKIEPESDDLLVAMAKLDGLKLDEAVAEFGIDPADAKKHGFLLWKSFSNSSKARGIDEMREVLAQYGYPVGDTVAEFGDAIQSALAGETVATVENIEADIQRRVAAYEEDYRSAADIEQDDVDKIAADGDAVNADDWLAFGAPISDSALERWLNDETVSGRIEESGEAATQKQSQGQENDSGENGNREAAKQVGEDETEQVAHDFTFVVSAGEYDPMPASQDAIAKAKDSVVDTLILEIGERPSGKRWYTAYVSDGNGEFDSVSIGAKLDNVSRESIINQAREKRKHRLERNNAAAEQKKKNVNGAVNLGIRVGVSWSGAQAYVNGRNGLVTYDKATIYAFDESTGDISVDVYKRGMRAPERIVTTYTSRLFDTYPKKDLLGDNTAKQQSVADAERAKDEKRNSGESNSNDFTLTGSDREADQAEARGAQELFGLKKYSDPQRASALVDSINEGELILKSGRNNGRELSQAELDAIERSVENSRNKLEALRDDDGGVALFSRIQQSQTETPEFKSWFGDSKVVDAKGKPLVVYHGTVDSFDSFDKKHQGKVTRATSSKAGFFFTSSPRTAQSYADHAALVAPVERLIDEADKAGDRGKWDKYDAKITEAESLEAELSDPVNRGRGQNIVAAYLTIKNPLVFDAKGETPEGIGGINALIDKAKSNGNDGVIVKNFDDSAGLSNDNADHYIVFSPTQIKSAIGNRGTFDPNNPNIAMSRGGGKGLSKQSTQDIVDAIRAKWKNAPEIVVVDNMNDQRIRNEVRDENQRQLSQGAQGQPEGFFDAGKVYIVSSEMNNVNDVVRVLMHETLGHYGMRGVYGKDLEIILKQVAMLRRTDVTAKARKYGLDINNERDRMIAAEEVLSGMAQTSPQISWVKRAIAAIRTWLRDHVPMLNGMELSNAEIIRNYLEPARRFVENGMPDGQNSGGMFSRSAISPTFYSQLARGISQAKQDSMPAGQWKLWLQSNAAKLGIKKDEIQWSGVADWLDMQQGKVSKADIAAYLDGNGVQVKDVMLGKSESETKAERDKIYADYDSGVISREERNTLLDKSLPKNTKYDTYTVPGGDNYKELLLTLPVNENQIDGLTVDGVAKALGYSGWHYSLTEDQKSHINRVFDAQKNRPNTGNEKRPTSFKSSHFDQPNILAHVRFDERTDADGNKVLFIHEIQSDFAQTKRAGKHDISAPFIDETKAWVSLAIKRMMIYAANNSFDKVAFITGEQAAGLYDLSKQVDSVSWEPGFYADGGRLVAMKDGRTIIDEGTTTDKIEDFVGKDVAKKLTESGEDTELSGLDLKVGGEGMKAFYDKIVPQVASDVLKRLGVLKKLGGGKVEPISFKGEQYPKAFKTLQGQRINKGLTGEQLGFTITPAMRDQIMQGLPLFSRKATSGITIPEETSGQTFTRIHQNKLNRILVVQNAIDEQGGQVGTSENVYQAMERSTSRSSEKMKTFRRLVVDPLMKRAANIGVSLDEIDTYLMALGAKDRNALIQSRRSDMPDNGSGISNAQADEIVADYKKRHNFAEIDKLARDIQAVTKDKLKLLVKSKVMTQQQADDWDSAQPFYVPYKGFEIYDDNLKKVGNGVGAGYSTSKRVSKQAFGRISTAGQVTANIFRDYDAAIILAEKAHVGEYLRNLVEKNPDSSLWTINKPEKQAALVKTYDPLFVSVYGNQEKEEMLVNSKVVYRDTGFDNETEVRYIHDGKEFRIQIHDPLFIRAYNNLGAESQGALLEAATNLNSFLRQMYVQKNPNFLLKNTIRDSQAAFVTMTGEFGFTEAINAMKLAPSAARAAFSMVQDRHTGTEWDGYIDLAKKSGALMQFAMMDDIETEQLKLEEMIAKHGADSLVDSWKRGVDIFRQGKKVKGSMLTKYGTATSRAAQFAIYRALDNQVFNTLEALNGASENAMRLTAFRHYIDMHGGIKNVTPDVLSEASRISKNLTINFSQAGEKSGVLNAAYLFWKANVNGTANVHRVLTNTKHKRQAQAICAGLFLLGVMMAFLTGDDDDELSAGYDKEHNILIHGKNTTFKIILAYGFGFFYGAGYSFGNMMRGRITPIKAAMEIIGGVFNNFSPAGSPVADGEFDSKAVAMMVTPTMIDPVTAIAVNRNSFGGKLVPHFSENDEKPDRETMYRGTRGTIYDNASNSKMLAWADISPETLKFMVNTFTGGSGGFVSGLYKTVSDSITVGKRVEVENIPLVNAAYASKDVEEYRGRFYRQTSEVKALAIEGKVPQKAILGTSAVMWEKRMKRLRDQEDAARNAGDWDAVYRIESKQTDFANKFNSVYHRSIDRLNNKE